jgi:hypothetical protein
MRHVPTNMQKGLRHPSARVGGLRAARHAGSAACQRPGGCPHRHTRHVIDSHYAALSTWTKSAGLFDQYSDKNQQLIYIIDLMLSEKARSTPGSIAMGDFDLGPVAFRCRSRACIRQSVRSCSSRRPVESRSPLGLTHCVYRRGKQLTRLYAKPLRLRRSKINHQNSSHIKFFVVRVLSVGFILVSAFVRGDCTYVVLSGTWLSFSDAKSPLHETGSDREHCKCRKQHDKHGNT